MNWKRCSPSRRKAADFSSRLTAKATSLAASYWQLDRNTGNWAFQRSNSLPATAYTTAPSADGAFQAGKEVCVIGGGNTALQDAVLLSGICKTVHIIQDLPELTGERLACLSVSTKNNVTVTTSTVVDALLGETLFRCPARNTKTGQVKELPVSGIFVAIGQVPENTAFAPVASLDERGYLVSGEDC